MENRGYKLQEFEAHAGNVNCLSFGKKNYRVFITGGDDQKVNLWSVGKPTPTISLCGHASPVESAAFDPSEVWVAGGSSSGSIKLWDLEETKMVRTIAGHRSYCTAVEFHPFGEFFASGSMDTHLKLWDMRKKGCIHTYKGHTRGISKIRFTPDGRWVVSSGVDNVVKVWDLTAGKLLHDFKSHEGCVRSIEFHPLEFLLATGSADKTVKFWDLETLELIGSTKCETSGVRSITFHPDGKSLFCGLDDCLKVYSWEPVVCQDSVDMRWSLLGDLCIHDGKLLGGSYYENSVAVWVADVSLIKPHGTRLAPEQHSQLEQRLDNQGSVLEKEESHLKSKSYVRSTTPDSDSKEIKTIYVDCVKSVTPKTVNAIDVPKVAHQSDSKEIDSVRIQKRTCAANLPEKCKSSAFNRTLVTMLPRDGKDLIESRKVSLTSAKVSNGMSIKPSYVQKPSRGQLDMERMSVSPESVLHNRVKGTGTKKNSNLCNRLVSDEYAKESSDEKRLNVSTALEKCGETSSPSMTPIGISYGRRTHSLVERFERKVKLDLDEIQKPHGASVASDKSPRTPLSHNINQKMIIMEEPDNNVIENMMQNHDVLLSTFKSRLTRMQVLQQHYLGRGDVKGAINAVRNMSDHSVQTDTVCILMERLETITLDLFSCLLPLLLGLLESKVDRHVIVSLEMLLKLVAVFGETVRSTVSAPPVVGVDLHAEERLECCKQCSAHFQDIQKVLPQLIQKGGFIASYARQLNLVLVQP